MLKTERLQIVPLDMDCLEKHYEDFNSEITKYQWPDPFETIEEARGLLQDFINEMKAEECPELGIWISECEQKKGYAYEALKAVLDHACINYHKRTFFYEADIRNEGSTKLLYKLENQFEILKQGLEETTTDSGKMLKLQGYVLKAK